MEFPHPRKAEILFEKVTRTVIIKELSPCQQMRDVTFEARTPEEKKRMKNDQSRQTGNPSGGSLPQALFPVTKETVGNHD
jgi:hypothetical protein